MPNSYFQFKQFIVYQHKSSMKVCTDACILGAYAAKLVNGLGVTNCLDIGTGTGLLSLMLAQECNLKIDAIDIYENAVVQAGENFKLSLWTERLNVFNGDIKYFTAREKYDFIITNPPFYQNDLTSPQLSKNVAKHSESMTLVELIEAIDRNLSTSGHFIILLPFRRVEQFELLSLKLNFYLHRKLLIKHSPKHNFFRGILLFGRTEEILVEEELVIRDDENNYTREFISLLKKYYLHL